MSTIKHRGGPVVHLNPYPTPPRHRVKLRTGKSKNRGVAPGPVGSGSSASSQVKRRDVSRFTKNGAAMKAWFQGGCK